MKRRVRRAHANKKHLRLVCASNHLALDAYNILCDSSFIRAVVLHFLKKPHIVPRGQRLDAAKVGTLAASLMRELIDDAFNATDSAGKGTAAQSVGKPSGAERVRLNLFYLPETRTALLRMCNDVASTSRNQNLRPQQASSVSDARVKESAGGSAISTEMISAVLATMRCLAEKPASTSGAKEVRAIAGLMTPSSGRGVAPVDSHSGPTRGVKNENHYFIATQNHDVRRALPPQAGLLRLTQQPEGVWIEQAAEYTYTGSRDGANSFLSHQSLHFGGGKALSAADVAFMRSLGTSETPSRTATQKPTQSPTAAPTPATEGTIQEEAGSQPPKPKRKRKRGQASPNPLSMKKKQHREVFRADG